MPSDFETLAREARASITVPAMNLQSIRQASRSALPARRKPRIAIATIAAAFSMAAIAAAAVLTTGHVNVTKSGGLVITGKILNHRATPAVLDAAIHNASFRAVLPDGLPAGTVMRSVLTAGSDVIALEYDLPGAWRRTDHILYVILANPAAVNGKFRPPNMQLQLRAPHPRIASWRIGAEQIYISSDNLTPIELARIKAAMQKEAGQ